jgi:hypothetical protein
MGCFEYNLEVGCPRLVQVLAKLISFEVLLELFFGFVRLDSSISRLWCGQVVWFRVAPQTIS